MTKCAFLISYWIIIINAVVHPLVEFHCQNFTQSPVFVKMKRRTSYQVIPIKLTFI